MCTVRRGAIVAGLASFVLASRASTCPKQRFTAVANGHQRSVAVARDLRKRRSVAGLTMLPKLAVRVRFLRPLSPIVLVAGMTFPSDTLRLDLPMCPAGRRPLTCA